VVNVDVRSRGPGGAVVRALPAARGSGAGRVDNDVGAVALEHGLARVAATGGDPVRKEITVIGTVVDGSLDCQCSQLRFGSRGRGDATL